jgi:hypothetical protein
MGGVLRLVLTRYPTNQLAILVLDVSCQPISVLVSVVVRCLTQCLANLLVSCLTNSSQFHLSSQFSVCLFMDRRGFWNRPSRCGYGQRPLINKFRSQFSVFMVESEGTLS